MKYWAILFGMFLFFPQTAHAQLKIGKFYSESTSDDWVEIINDTNTQISFSDYMVTDIAGNKIQQNINISPNGNCVFDWGNRLNNGGDIIFLLKNDSQIDCIKYGEPKKGECSRIESSSSETKPVSSCFESTPEPTNEPTTPPTKNPTNTPAPTVVLTAKPKPSPTPKVLSTKTAKPTATPTLVKESEEKLTIEEPKKDETSNSLAQGLMATGIAITGGAVGVIFKKEYNEKRTQK